MGVMEIFHGVNTIMSYLDNIASFIITTIEEADKVKFSYEKINEECHIFTCDQFDVPILLILTSSYGDESQVYKSYKNTHIHHFNVSENVDHHHNAIEGILGHIFENLFTPVAAYYLFRIRQKSGYDRSHRYEIMLHIRDVSFDIVSFWDDSNLCADDYYRKLCDVERKTRVDTGLDF